MILYKYCPWNKYTITALALKGLWCHHATKMNDPFECFWTVDRKFSDDVLDQFREFSSSAKSQTLRKLATLDNQRLTESINKDRREKVKKYAFCSLSENPFDILMWSHYADSHQGIALGFEFEDFGNEKIFQKVRYAERLDEYDLMSWAWFMEGDDSLMVGFLRDLTIKSLDWEREKEWRIWRKEPCYYNYKSHEIKEILFGINCTAETKSIISRIVDLQDDVNLVEIETRNDPFGLVR